MSTTPTVESLPLDAVPRDLLLLADPSPEKVAGYAALGAHARILRKGGAILGVAVHCRRPHRVTELLNLAVAPDCQRRGWGRALIEDLVTLARTRGDSEIRVGTGTFGPAPRFYQSLGFVPLRMERDYFVREYPEALWEEGRQHRDRLLLTRPIQ